MWNKVYSAPAWPVEAAVTPSGQRKDVVNRGACWGMPTSKDKEHICRSTGTCTSIQALCIPTWRKQWTNRGTEIKLVVLVLCPFFGWEAALGLGGPDAFSSATHSQLWKVRPLPASHCRIYPGLHMWVWIPRQTKLAQKHTFDSQFYMQVHARSFGRVAGTSKHHRYELPKELFHCVLQKDVFVFPQPLVTDVPSPLLNYQK